MSWMITILFCLVVSNSVFIYFLLKENKEYDDFVKKSILELYDNIRCINSILNKEKKEYETRN